MPWLLTREGKKREKKGRKEDVRERVMSPLRSNLTD